MNDEYAWLRDKDWPKVEDPKILAHLNAENDHFQEEMLDVKNLEEQIYQELRARVKEEDQSYPIKKGDYYYFIRLEKNKDYPIYLRRKETEEELLLDANSLSSGKSSFAMGSNKISDDHCKLAYSYDADGSERYIIQVKDLTTKQDLVDKIEETIGNIVWNKASSGFYYVALNEQWRSDRVFFHKLGTTQAEDTLIYQELDHGFYLDISRSSSDEYLIIDTGNGSSNEIHYLSLNGEKLKLALKRTANHLYSLDHMNGNFYLLTNDMGKNFRLVSLADDSDFDQSKFQEIIAHHLEHYLVDIALYQKYLVVSKRILGLNKIEYYDLNSHNLLGKVDFNEEVYEAHIVFTTKEDNYLRISYSSLTQPKSTLEYEFANQVLHTRKIDEIASGYDASLYQAKRLWVLASDGAQIPISMVYRKDCLALPNKLLLYGYGSYGMAMPMSFRPNIISLLDRGFIYVIAHIRGGDELGFNWYESAKFLTKKRSFEDFIAVAEYLIKHKYTSQDKLAIMGGSAGGMLMGVVINERPDLFKAVVALVPFVDVLNTMLDETLPLTPPEFEEWGNPAKAEYYDYIKSYSPYDNIKKQKYPHMLVTAGLTDPRVGYWEAAKWVAKLRAYKQDDNMLLLKTEMAAGHKGQSGRFKGLEEVAMIYSFILKFT